MRDVLLLVAAAKDVLKTREAAMVDILEIRENRCVWGGGEGEGGSVGSRWYRRVWRVW